MKRYIALLICFLLLFSLTSCKTEDPHMTVTPENQNIKEEIITYKNFDKASFYYLSSLQIPNEWYLEENKNGFVVIEPKSGSEIAFIIEDYAPTINNVTYDSAKNSLTSNTKNFLSFQKTSGNELLSKYEWLVNNKKYVVTEHTKFNFKYIYTLKLICESKYVDKYTPVLTNMYKSLALSSEIKTIPMGYNGIYHEATGMLTVYPRDWKTTAGSDYYTSSYANTLVTVTYTKGISNFAGLDKTTYNGVMQQTIKNFSTASFVNQNGEVHAEGYYTENSVRYIVYNSILNAPNFSINIVYISPEKECATYQSVYATIMQNISMQKKTETQNPQPTNPSAPTESTQPTEPQSTEPQQTEAPTTQSP